MRLQRDLVGSNDKVHSLILHYKEVLETSITTLVESKLRATKQLIKVEKQD